MSDFGVLMWKVVGACALFAIWPTWITVAIVFVVLTFLDIG